MKKLAIVSASALAGFVFAVTLLGFALLRLEPARAGAPTGQGGTGDVNGDDVVDVSDAVFTLLYLFKGGAEPVACADSPELVGRVAALEDTNERIASALEALANPCRERADRFQDSSDGTVTDTCTGLEWQRSVDVAAFPRIVGQREIAGRIRFDEAQEYLGALSLGGKDDWRLPTTKELEGLLAIRRYGRNDLPFVPAAEPVFRLPSESGMVIWTGDAGNRDSERWVVNFSPWPFSNSGQVGLQELHHYSSNRDAYVLAVRGPVAP